VPAGVTEVDDDDDKIVCKGSSTDVDDNIGTMRAAEIFSFFPFALDALDSLITPPPDKDCKENEEEDDDEEEEEGVDNDDEEDEDNSVVVLVDKDEEENVRGLPDRTVIDPGHDGNGDGTCSSDFKSFASLPSPSAQARNSRKIANSNRFAINEPTLYAPVAANQGV
jgi:hypothetical protein